MGRVLCRIAAGRVRSASRSFEASRCQPPPTLLCTTPQHSAAAAAAGAAGGWQHCSRRGFASDSKRQPEVRAQPAADVGYETDEGADAAGELVDADDEFLQELEELEENVGPELSTGGVEWGEKALAVVQLLLSNSQSELRDIQLFSFRAIPSSKRLDIRLDKMTGAKGRGTCYVALLSCCALGRIVGRCFVFVSLMAAGSDTMHVAHTFSTCV